MAKRELRELRQQILKERGLVKRPRSKPSRFTVIDANHLCYTKRMMEAELVLGKPLREILFSKRDSELAKLLSVDKSTICRWRKRLRGEPAYGIK